MQNLLMGLLPQLATRTHGKDASREQLDALIEQLQAREATLEKQMMLETRRSRRLRLQIALDVAHLQEKKARALREG